MKKYLFGLIYGLLLAAFTGYVLLDAFVIRSVYQTVPSDDSAARTTQREGGGTGAEEEMERASEPDAPYGTAGAYSDDQIWIEITEYAWKDTAIYAAEARLASPDYLKTALADASYGKNVTQKTSEIAAAHGAILAINGDNYGARERGYVLRNGILYRDSASKAQEDLVIYRDGSFGTFEEGSVDAERLLSDGAEQILSFGPVLVRDGQIAVTEEDEVGRAKASNPRTAIGIVDELHYVFVVSDGRTDDSEGLTLYELAEFMQSLGARLAYNLDGGGSSTMVFNGEVINDPTTNGKSIKERSVSDIVYIGY